MPISVPFINCPLPKGQMREKRSGEATNMGDNVAREGKVEGLGDEYGGITLPRRERRRDWATNMGTNRCERHRTEIGRAHV